MDFHVSLILCIRMLFVKLHNSASSNFNLRTSEQYKTGRVLTFFECLTMAQSFCLSLLDMYGSGANIVHMTLKDLTKPLYQPTISSSRDLRKKRWFWDYCTFSATSLQYTSWNRVALLFHAWAEPHHPLRIFGNNCSMSVSQLASSLKLPEFHSKG